MRTFHAPGRVNLIGDHIDYLGGTVLPVAIDRGTTLRATLRDDRRVRATSANFSQLGAIDFDLDDDSPTEDLGWAKFLLGVALAMAEADLPATAGLDVEVVGNIPNGSGLSSSASLELAFAQALNAIGGYGADPTTLARICQRAENDFVGVACGIMDQLSIAAGRRGHAMAIDCGTLAVEQVPLPDGMTIVVANSHKRRELSESAYNARRASCERAEAVLGGRLVDRTPDELSDLLPRLPEEQRPLVRHVVTEQWRVLQCRQALIDTDLARVGELMRASHESLRDDFEVTGEHLDALVEAAWAAPGVIGARMTGAGFGGCTVNLVQPDAVDDFIAAVGPAYAARTGLSADFYAVASDDGAREVVA